MSLYSSNSAGSFKARVIFIILIKYFGFIILILSINIIKIYGASSINFLNSSNFKILKSSLVYLKR
jgi:hypothetical protein